MLNASYPSAMRDIAVLCVLCLTLYLPGMHLLPPFDRDEARFAQASKQMVETGDYVHIHFQDLPRNKKPIGIYWAQAASVYLFGQEEAMPIWVFRIPSVLGATLAVLLLYGFASKQWGREKGVLAASLLAVSLILVADAHQAKTDALLLATIVLMQGALWRIHSMHQISYLNICFFWLGLGLGILIKGPISLMVAGLTVLALMLWERRIALLWKLQPWWGIPILAVIVFPWFYLFSSSTGEAFVVKSFVDDILPKLIGGQESHGAPPGYYALTVWLTFWPGSLLLLPALVYAWQKKQAEHLRFILAWLVPAWLVFELVPTKLPHYTLPLFPALALLIADWWFTSGLALLSKKLRIIALSIWGVLTLILAAAFCALPLLLGMDIPFIGIAAALAALLALYHGVGVMRDKAGAGLRLCVATALMYASVFMLLPKLDPVWISRSVQNAMMPYQPTQLIATGYAEPSLVFLAGTNTQLVPPVFAASLLKEMPDNRIALVEAKEWAAFEAALEGQAYTIVDEVRGFNYSKGRWLYLKLVTLQEKE